MDKYDDLRSFLESSRDSIDSNSSLRMNPEEKFHVKSDRILDNLSVTKDVKALTERVELLEIITHSLWLVLEKHGYTDEEFDEAVDKVKNSIAKKAVQKNDVILCPKCGKQLQASVADSLSIKCIYCGYERTSNPFIDKVDSDSEADSEATEPKPVVDANEEYDLEKDLNFDM